MATTEPVAAHEESDKHLRKSLSFLDLLFLSMGGIIGSGWLLSALAAGSIAGPAVILSWVIGGILILFVALNYAEVAGMLPRSGAIVRYPHLTHGSYTGYILGWSYLLTAVTVPTIEAEAVVTYAASYIKGLTTVSGGKTILIGPGIAFAIGLTIVFFILNYLGIRFLGRFNQVVTWWKFIIPTLTFIFLFFTFHASNFSAGGGFAPLGTAPIFLAIATSGIVFSYLGFRQALDYGGEARNPQRDVPRATILSVILALILYSLIQVAFTGAVNWGAAHIKVGDWAGLAASSWANAPLYSELKAAGPAALGAFAVLLLIDAWISPSGTGWIYMGTSTRTVYGIGVDGYLPKIFQRVNIRTGVPVPALIGSLVVGWIFLLPLPSWYLLVGFISSATVLTYIMGGVGLQVMRRTARDLHRPYIMPAAPILAPLGFLAAALIVYWSGVATLNYVVTAVLIGLPLYAWFYAPRNMGANAVGSVIAGIVMLAVVFATAVFGPISQNKLTFLEYWGALAVEAGLFSVYMWMAVSPAKRHQITASAWFFALLLGIYLLSNYGAFGPSGVKPFIPFPWDTLIAIVFSLVIFYWAVAAGHSTPEIEAIIAAQKVSAEAPQTPPL
jgi:amino acid transporter